jgi:hypothetical protein
MQRKRATSGAVLYHYDTTEVSVLTERQQLHQLIALLSQVICSQLHPDDSLRQSIIQLTTQLTGRSPLVT